MTGKGVRSNFLYITLNIIAQEIVDDIETALYEFRLTASDLGKGSAKSVDL